MDTSSRSYKLLLVARRCEGKYISRNIKNSKPPRKHKCDELIDAYPDVFHNKERPKIKVFIHNQYWKKVTVWCKLK
nr:unnamed protein product [Callosobruchus analis]